MAGYPSGTLISIYKALPFGNSVSLHGSLKGKISILVQCVVLCSGQNRF
jgi:hypothetical protein